MKLAAGLASLLLLAVACGTPSASTPASGARASQASIGFTFDIQSSRGDVVGASAARTTGWITCSGAIGASDSVAVVQMHSAVDTGELVLRDYADPRNPRTACQFQTEQAGHGYRVAQLIDAHHVVIATNDCCQLYAVVDLPEVRFHWFQLPRPAGFAGWLLAVSPRLDEVAWLSNNDSTGDDRKVHLTSKSGDQVVASLPIALGRCGAPSISKNAAYTHSGGHLYVLDQPLPDNTLLVFQGNKQVLSVAPPGAGRGAASGPRLGTWPNGAQPEMAVWSPTSETLFYRQNGDIWQWTQAAGAQRFLPGVNWYYPTFTPSGSHLAYAVLRSDGLHDIYLIDMAHGGSPQLLKGARNLPVFLNSTQLWYWSEGQGICGPGLNRPLIYDITDGSEAGSIIDFITAVWPATTSNF